MHRFVYSFLIVFAVLTLAGCNKTAQQAAPENVPSANENTPSAEQEQSAQMDSNREEIDFTPDPSPMPDCQSWIDRANAKDPAAMFVMHMMYRDKLCGVEHIADGKPTQDTLNADQMKYERTLWLNRLHLNGCDRMFSSVPEKPALFYPDNSDFYDKYKAEADHPEAPKDGSCGPQTDIDIVAWLEEAAKRGHGNAEYILGLYYWHGFSVIAMQADKAKGYDLIRRAAMHGIPNAQYHLAMIYELGLERPTDPQRANEWLQRAMDNGNTDAAFILAMKYADGIDMPMDAQRAKSIEDKFSNHIWIQLRQKVQTDFDFECCCNYDTCALKRWNCNNDSEPSDDIEEAPEADARSREIQTATKAAQNSLEYSLDLDVASRWLIQAAQAPEHIEIRYQLIRLLNMNCDFDSDLKPPSQDSILLPLAQSGYPNAKYLLARYYLSQCGSNPQNAKLALEWYLNAAQDNDKHAALTLAEIYSVSSSYYQCVVTKNHIERDVPKAIEYALKAEEREFAAGIAGAEATRFLDNKDERKAIEWYQKAIELDDKNDPLIGYYDMRIAKIYDLGSADIQDKDKALEYYQIAAEQHGFMATHDWPELKVEIIRLGILYDKGTPSHKADHNQALKWYKLGLEASQNTDDSACSGCRELVDIATKALKKQKK